MQHCWSWKPQKEVDVFNPKLILYLEHLYFLQCKKLVHEEVKKVQLCCSRNSFCNTVFQKVHTYVCKCISVIHFICITWYDEDHKRCDVRYYINPFKGFLSVMQLFVWIMWAEFLIVSKCQSSAKLLLPFTLSLPLSPCTHTHTETVE